MASKILSIDLQSDLLTAALLADDTNRNLIDSAVIIIAEKTVDEIIAELESSLDCSDCRCFLSLGSSFFSFRNLRLPFSDRKSIDKILPFELEESTAEAVDSMIIDVMVSEAEEEGAEVITAMIKRETLAEFHNALKNAKLNPEIITLSGLPTIAAIQANGYPPDEFLFLDLRLHGASLFLISGGKLQLVRPLAFYPLASAPDGEGGFVLNDEEGKILLQGVKNIDDSLTNLALTVKQTLTPLPLITPQQELPIYINGSVASAESTSQLLEATSAFNRPCLTCGRGGLLPSPVGLPAKTEQHVSFLTACLCLGSQAESIKNHSFNFCKEEFCHHKKLISYSNLGKLVGLPLILILLVGLTALWYQTKSLEQQRTALVAEINRIFKTTLPEVGRVVDPVQQLQVAVDNTRLSSADDGGSPILPHTVRHILREISMRIPHSLDIRLTRLIYESKGLRLMGLTDSFNTVDSMKKKLQLSPDFTTVTISSTKQNPKDKKIRFELKIDVGGHTP